MNEFSKKIPVDEKKHSKLAVESGNIQTAEDSQLFWSLRVEGPNTLGRAGFSENTLAIFLGERIVQDHAYLIWHITGVMINSKVYQIVDDHRVGFKQYHGEYLLRGIMEPLWVAFEMRVKDPEKSVRFQSVFEDWSKRARSKLAKYKTYVGGVSSRKHELLQE